MRSARQLCLVLLLAGINVAGHLPGVRHTPEPDPVTVHLDHAGAEALIEALERDSLSDAAVDSLLSVHGVRAMVDNVTRFVPEIGEPEFRQEVKAFARTKERSTYGRYFQLDDVWRSRAEVRTLIAAIRADEQELVGRTLAQLGPYQPSTGPLAIRVFFAAGGVSTGFLFESDFQAFYINLARAQGNFHGVVWNIVHEAYHVMQMAAQQRSGTFVAWITDATVPPVERLLAGTLQEGTATYVADPARLSADEGVLQSVRDRYRRSTEPERLAENFATFDTVLQGLRRRQITWDEAYVRGFALSPEHEERFYFVGYEMTRAIDKYCGAECVRRLFERHPVEFFRQYIALYREHPDIAARFSPDTEALLEQFQLRPEVPSSAAGPPTHSTTAPPAAAIEHSRTPADSLHVRVLAIHDFHGTLRPLRPTWAGDRAVGGAAALKAHMDSAAARCSCPAIRLDGGDQMQGSLDSSLSHGAAVVAALNAVGIDAAAIGNHDLGWGVDTLKARQAQARYAWLAANVFMRGGYERPGWAKPYVILDRGGVRVAVIGYATTETPATLRPATTAPYEFRRGIDGVRAALSEVREHAPDFTVITAHARGDCSAGECQGEMVELAQALDPDEVQLIAGGHEHAAAEAVVNGIPIVRASSHSRALSVVDLFRTATGERHFHLSRDTLFVDAVEPDRGVEDLIGPYLARGDSAAGAPITVLNQPLAARSTEHLGNLITDAMRLAAGTDVALSNVGGIRAGLPAGAVTYTDAHRVLPFDNMLVRVLVSGEQLRWIAEVAVRQVAPDDFSGVTVYYDPDRPPGSRVLSLVLDNGSDVEDTREYSLVVPSYIAEGGGAYGLIAELPAVTTDLPMLDAFIEHLRRLPQPVVAPGESRAVARRPGAVLPGHSSGTSTSMPPSAAAGRMRSAALRLSMAYDNMTWMNKSVEASGAG